MTIREKIQKALSEAGLSIEINGRGFLVSDDKEEKRVILIDKGDDVIVWSVEDILGVAEERDVDLTEEQAQRLLTEMIGNHDCENGITWNTVAYYVDEYVQILS